MKHKILGWGGGESMVRRTDLAVEAKEIWLETAEETTQLPGVRATEGESQGYPVTVVEVLDDGGAAALGKPVGRYVTLDVGALSDRPAGGFQRAAQAVAGQLKQMLPKSGGTALVVGLGNRAITPDVIGPKVADLVLATRHLVETLPGHFGDFRPVAVVATGVLGTTGVESGELVEAVAGQVKPCCVIAIDALCGRSLERLGTTIQLSDTGIVPGSGVGNHRHPLDEATLGVPVIAIGVPTVVEAATLCADVLEEGGVSGIDVENFLGIDRNFLVTPKDIDTQVMDMAKVVGYGINLALQEGMTWEEVEGLVQ